jgi:hypothetical protein
MKLLAITISLALFTAYAVAARAADEASAKFSPSAQLRSAILSGDRGRFPYPGTATDNAVMAGYDDIVVKLLMDPDRRKAEGPGALLAAIQTPDPHMVGLILALGVSPNEVDGGGPGALAYTVVAGENKTLCRLVDYGVGLKGGRAPHLPMLTALMSGNLDAAELLRFIGYTPDEAELKKLQDLGKKREQWRLWDSLLSIAPSEERAVRLCQRINAVPSPPTRIR